MVYSVYRHYERVWNVPAQFAPTVRTSNLKAFNVDDADFVVLARKETPQPLNEFDVSHKMIEWAVVAASSELTPRTIPGVVQLGDRMVPNKGIFVECETAYPDGRKSEYQFLPRVAVFSRDEIKYANAASANKALALLVQGAANLKESLVAAGKLPESDLKQVHGHLSRFFVGLEPKQLVVEPGSSGAGILNNWDEAFGWL